jgi:hypothetical protein
LHWTLETIQYFSPQTDSTDYQLFPREKSFSSPRPLNAAADAVMLILLLGLGMRHGLASTLS